MTATSTFFCFSLYQSHIETLNLSEKIEELEKELNQSEARKITQTIVEQDRQLSWTTEYKNRELLLKIKRISNSQETNEEICVLLVKKIDNKDNENEFYLSGKKRVEKNDCQKPSLAIPKENGIWELEHSFPDPTSRIIRVEEIHKNNRTFKSYVDFTIGWSLNQGDHI